MCDDITENNAHWDIFYIFVPLPMMSVLLAILKNRISGVCVYNTFLHTHTLLLLLSTVFQFYPIIDKVNKKVITNLLAFFNFFKIRSLAGQLF
jgi:hypothetical protein